jgi:hypothetical protein
VPMGLITTYLLSGHIAFDEDVRKPERQNADVNRL